MNGLAMYVDNSAVGQNELVIKYAPLVKRIAYHLMSRLPPSVLADDLIQSGMIGLLEAARNYDASQGASFETYAGIRIRGSMLDEIRRCDWTPRSLHRKVREVSAAIREIELEQGRDARDSEVCDKLGISIQEYHVILKDASGHKLFSFEDLPVGEESISQGLQGEPESPLKQLEMAKFKEHLAAHIDNLPERERLVMSLYYDEELNLREIGAVLGVSESRVCQIHGQALMRLKARMVDWREEE